MNCVGQNENTSGEIWLASSESIEFLTKWCIFFGLYQPQNGNCRQIGASATEGRKHGDFASIVRIPQAITDEEIVRLTLRLEFRLASRPSNGPHVLLDGLRVHRALRDAGLRWR